MQTAVRKTPAAGFLLCSVGPAASVASSALDPAVSPAVALATSPAVALETSGAVDPVGAAAEVLGAAGPCGGAALMLSMRVSTILTAVCRSRQQALGGCFDAVHACITTFTAVCKSRQ